MADDEWRDGASAAAATSSPRLPSVSRHQQAGGSPSNAFAALSPLFTPGIADAPRSALDPPHRPTAPGSDTSDGEYTLANGDAGADENHRAVGENGSNKKRRTLASAVAASSSSKKSKKKSSNVWCKPSSRKGKKKSKPLSTPHGAAGGGAGPSGGVDTVLMTPVPRLPDRSDDSPDAPICLSRVYKAEKVDLSDDRLTAGSTKGYRMVRATRGVVSGAWYFEVRITHLGKTGHTRLGWVTDKGDLQAPVGYDSYGFGYRDIDGAKIHKARRQKYGDEGYGEHDVIGFYISLPEGEAYAPKPPHLVWYKGQRYMYPADGKDEPLKIVPGSEIAFFKNGVFQGTAFRDLFGGRYYPAASMYTLPNQSNCEVTFNFGPHFESFPSNFEGRPIPQPMIAAEYHGYDYTMDTPVENGNGVPDKLS